MDQVTAVLAEPVTVAENCLGGDAGVKLALAGATDTDTVTTGASVTVAAAVLVESATLVAVTVTVCWEVTLAGAVYRPDEEIEPTFGEMDQVTAVLEVPVTVAANCWGGDAGVKLTLAGATDTDTVADGTSVTVAAAVLLVSATLVAVTATVCWEVMLAGAVYMPDEETEPTLGEMDQVTAVFEEPVTVAANCPADPFPNDAVAGETEIVSAPGTIHVPSCSRPADLDTELVADIQTCFEPAKAG
jgi:hypothetical protein